MSYKPLNQNKMEQSAVEWLEEQVDRIIETYDVDMMRYHLEKAYEQAKDIELKNLLSAQSEAYLRGYNDGQKYNN